WLKELSKRQKKADDVQKIADSVYGIEKKQLPYILCVTNMLVHGADEPRIYHDNALLRDLLDYTDDDRFDVILMNPPYGGSEKLDVQNHFPKDLRSSETADLFVATIAYRLKRGGRAAVVLPDGFLFGSDSAKINIKRRILTEFNLHTIVRLPGSVFAPYTSIATNLLFFDRTGPTRETWFYRLDMPEGYKHFSKTKPMTSEHFEPARAWWKERVEIEVDGAPKAKRFDVAELGEATGFDWDRCGFPRYEEEILDPKETIERYQAKRAELNRRVDATLAAIREKLGIATEDEDE
ncbi:MAG: N-6 DNA methylase, partial [Thermoguttaceae bacterium]|nr:N-6 DNA methylase [Thermoguttaceae bacterium]